MTCARTEQERLTQNQQRVLRFLLRRGPIGATNVELSAPEVGGLGGVRRLWDLQQLGWQVRKAHEEGGRWRYWIEGHTDPGETGRLF